MCAYVNQVEKRQIAEKIKPLLKQYGLKGSLSIEHHSKIVLTIKSGKLDFINNYIEKNTLEQSTIDYLKEVNHIDVNCYWIDERFSGRIKEFLEQAVVFLKGDNWFDKSDIQSDYFHVKHYFDIQIGRWNKPYTLEV